MSYWCSRFFFILASIQALAAYMADSDRLAERSPPIVDARMDRHTNQQLV